MFWDYLSQNPESVHQVMILMGDRGIPDGFRHMHGYYGHTLKIVNDVSCTGPPRCYFSLVTVMTDSLQAGEWVYAQFHLISDQGTKNLTADEAAKL